MELLLTYKLVNSLYPILENDKRFGDWNSCSEEFSSLSKQALSALLELREHDPHKVSKLGIFMVALFFPLAAYGDQLPFTRWTMREEWRV